MATDLPSSFMLLCRGRPPRSTVGGYLLALFSSCSFPICTVLSLRDLPCVPVDCHLYVHVALTYRSPPGARACSSIQLPTWGSPAEFSEVQTPRV